MTEQLHPMVPPNILLNNWESDWLNERENIDVLLTRAYQAGADTELEATLAEVSLLAYRAFADRVRAARRPKPPSLKEQALEDLDQIDGHAVDQLSAYLIHDDLKRRVSNIRRALEGLPDD
jgi:hypothetical protein